MGPGRRGYGLGVSCDSGAAPGRGWSVWDQTNGTPWGQPILALDSDETNGCFKTNRSTSQAGPYFDPPPRTLPPQTDSNGDLLVDDDDDGLLDPSWYLVNDGRFDLTPDVTGIRSRDSDGGFVDFRAVGDAFTRSIGGKGVDGYERLDGLNTFIEVVYDFENGMSLEWLTGTSDYERDYALDNRNGPFFTNFQHRDEDFQQWSTEVRLRSAGDQTIEWEVGGFFQNTELDAFSSSLRANVRQSQRFNTITEEVDFTGFFAHIHSDRQLRYSHQRKCGFAGRHHR